MLFVLLCREEPLGFYQGTKNINLYLFHSEDCQSCQSVVPGLKRKLESMYPSVNIILLDLKETKNYEILRAFEQRTGRRGEELPFVVIGNHLLSGEKELEEKLDPIILECLLKCPEDSTKELKIDEKKKDISGELLYFYQSGCPKCGRTDVLLDYLVKKYPKISVKRIDLSSREGTLLAESIGKKLNIAEDRRLLAPSVLAGRSLLSPGEITEEKIEELLEAEKERPTGEFLPKDFREAEESIIHRFKSFRLWAVVLGGLIDGINPCAFATLIFLISYLRFRERKRGEILRVGIGFTGAVFLTYLLIGAGLLTFIQRFSLSSTLSRWIYLLTAIFALILGSLSFCDFLLWKKGKEKEMKLQLPDTFKKLIHKTIRRVDLSRYQVFGAVFLGFSVSVFEFTCTGQVYLPTIIFVLNDPGMRINAIFHLLLYNLAFIIPLLSVFILFYLGTEERRFGLFLKDRGPLIKLFTSVFFLLLGMVMILNLP
jgi:cytochrome c biogenesis protein CcdA/thiol-disulfide isomerase/thioredoxin